MATRTDSSLWAWGYNVSGEVGGGTTVNKTVPTQIGTGTNWVSPSAGGMHTLAIRAS